MKPIDEWTEEYVSELPSGEDDRFDRKASQALIDCAGSGSDKKRIDLSCDVSAFANSGGGFLVFGANNSGMVDGGVPIRLKPSGTYDWLDSLTADLVQPSLRGYRIKEIRPNSPTSRIGTDKAIYVLSIPDSEDAPHQAKDGRYYLRINAHNARARHQQIEDIRGRRRNPAIDGHIEFEAGDMDHRSDNGTVVVTLWPVCRLANVGQVTARDACLIITGPDFLKVTNVPTIGALVNCVADSDRRVQCYLKAPLHPGQTRSWQFGSTTLILEYGTFLENQSKKEIRDISFDASLYVDDAPPIKIDGAFASNRVSWALRNKLQGRFDWDDPRKDKYR